MNKKVKLISAFVLGLTLFSLSFLIQKNEVCCMFAGVRKFGWPLQVFSISKVTESYQEAEKVQTLGTHELLVTGWTTQGDENALLSVGTKAAVNLLISLTIAFAATHALSLVVDGRMKQTKPNGRKQDTNGK